MGQNLQSLGPTDFEDLTYCTHFKQKEIMEYYYKFKKDHPSGYIKKHEFIKIYRTFYKKGDASKFSEHVFRVFDNNCDGKIGKSKFYSYF